MGDPVTYGAHQSNSEAGHLLATFWPRAMSDIRNKPFLQTKSNGKKDEPIQELPLARIKKIMKQDGDVKMISAEAPILFAKAAEIFISELSLRAWIHTEDNKRRTLQRNDIAMAITKYDQFDFLIDIVPRDELKPTKRQDEAVRQPPNVMAPEQVQYYFQLSQLQSNASAASPGSQQLTQIPAGTHVIQQNGQIFIASPQQLNGLTASSNGTQQAQIVQIQGQDNTSEGSVVPSASSEISNQNTQGTTQVQFSSGGQVHYVRLPNSALQGGTSAAALSQVILQQQQLQQQQQQQQQNQTQESTSGEQQIYGSSANAVYVMSQPGSQDNETANST